MDLNREGKFETIPLIDFDLHVTPVRLAARLLDPDAFVICSAIMKTHNAVVATLSVKNLTLGAPLHNPPGEKRWNDKRKYHVGVRQNHYNMLLTAQKLQPNWGATVIDGYEGMEGDGPNSGNPVPSRIAIASTDYIAADRVGLEAMGIDPVVGGLPGVLRPGRTGKLRPEEDSDSGRGARRRAQKVSPAPRHRPRVAVDGADGRLAPEVGFPPERRDQDLRLKRASGW